MALTTSPAQATAMKELCARIEDSEQAHRRRSAADFNDYISLLLLLAQQQDPRITADTLTLALLQQENNGKLLRRASTTLAQLKGIPEARAKRLLRLTLNLHQHGQDLLTKLAAGTISTETVVQAAQHLASIALPNPHKDPEGQPWDAGAYQDHRERVEDAKTHFGTALAESAARSETEEDFRRQAHRLREEHHPANTRQRHQDARAKRRVTVHDGDDGMSTLTAFIPTPHAHSIARGLRDATNAAHRQGHAAGRSRTQLEADLFVQALSTAQTHNGTQNGTQNGSQDRAEDGTDEATPATVQTPSPTRPAAAASVLLLLTLEDAVGLGACLAEGQLEYLHEKYPELYRQALANRTHFATAEPQRAGASPPGLSDDGPTPNDLLSGDQLDVTTAAEYFHRASFMRAVITDPISGYPLGIGRRHQPDDALKELIILRDQHCRHPGCSTPARDCELNHTDPWAHGGATSYPNLELACRHHHTGLSARWWTVTAAPEAGDGARTFTDAATGRETTTKPELPLDADAWEDYRAALDSTDQPPY